MSPAAISATKPFTIDVSPDRMSARIKPGTSKKKAKAAPINREEIIAALRKSSIVITQAVTDRIDAFLELVEQDKVPNDGFTVAEGTPPHNGRDGRFIWDERWQREAEAWQTDAPAGHVDPTTILRVRKDASIGHVEPPDEPRDGMDVTGRVIPHRGSPVPLALNPDTLRLDGDDGAAVISRVDGRLVQRDRTLFVEPVLVIEGDVDLERGNVNSAVGVHIDGRIGENRIVRSGGDIVVGASIDAANVAAAGSVLVRNGILGQKRGLVRTQRNITAKFCNEAQLWSDGDIKIGRQLMNCCACIGGRLESRDASVIGGFILAEAGVRAGKLGSDANVPTRLVVGLSAAMVAELALIDRRLATCRVLIDRIDALLKPHRDARPKVSDAALANLDQMLETASQASQRLCEEEARRQRLLQDLYGPQSPTIEVAEFIHPAVSVCIADRVTMFNKGLKGPIRVEKRKIKNVTELVAIDRHETVKILKSERCSPEEAIDGFDLLAAASAGPRQGQAEKTSARMG